MANDFPTIKRDDASEILSMYRTGKLNSAEFNQFVEGDFLRAGSKDIIHSTMLKLFECFNVFADQSKHKSGLIDNELGQILHEDAKIQSEWARDPGFWIWLTFSDPNSLGAHIIDGRFLKDGMKPGSAKDVHYGLAQMKSGYFAKIWLHAEISFRACGDYSLLSITDVDFWDSHVLDVDYGFASNIVRAFHNLIIEEKIPRGKIGSGEEIGFRHLSKELTRRNPTTCFELMDFDASLNYVRQLWYDRLNWAMDNE